MGGIFPGNHAAVYGLQSGCPVDGFAYDKFIVIDASHPPILLHSQSSQSPRTVWLETGNNKILITVKAGATLTLKHITLQGQEEGTYNIALISTAGDLVLESGASVKDGKKTNGGGFYTGGVYVRSGTFTMNKGTISGNKNGNYGGGVWVVGGSTFTMNGGVISGNSADYFGGGVMVFSSSNQFTMNGGVISGNSANIGGGGVAVRDGATFTMYGGSIRGNTGGGEYGGGGVIVLGVSQFTKTGGVIYGSDAANALKNTATNGNGHAVYVASSPAKKRDSTADEVVTLDSGSSGGWE
jgi:hypothetical protein